MNREFGLKWVEALRSGKYSQVQGKLRRDEGFCCLGVACDLLNPEGWEKHTPGEVFFWTDGPARMNNYLTAVPRSKIGLSSFEQDELAAMNDAGSTFSEIADRIEANLIPKE